MKAPDASSAMDFVEHLRDLEEEQFGEMVRIRWPRHVRDVLDEMFHARLTTLAQTLDELRSLKP